jgi:putative flavoprotein involved in K+ transport
MQSQPNVEHFHTIIIGGGQAGLTLGYYLRQRKLPFVVLDAHDNIGDAWRNRWDSLRLFTPARFIDLPGLPYPGPRDAFPTKEQMATYLEVYAKRLNLPVRTGMRVSRVHKQGDAFIVHASGQRFEAGNVVVAMSNYQVPKVPDFAHELRPSILQVHSHEYRNPSQLQTGPVLVVGAGNSGADIAIELARHNTTLLSGTESGQIPWPIETFFSRNVLFRMIRFVGHHLLTLSTPIGRKVRPKMLAQATPLVRVKRKDLVAAGVERVPRVVGVQDGRPLLENGRLLDVTNVVWCTGFRPGFSWVDLPVFDEKGYPRHHRGVSNIPGLYFLGLHFLYAMSSGTLIGIGRDAAYIAGTIQSRTRFARAA